MNLIPKRIIEKAIDGGWTPRNLPKEEFAFLSLPEREWKGLQCELIYEKGNQARYVLDPIFWQALGRACGWGITPVGYIEWKWHWHRFIDVIAECDSPVFLDEQSAIVSDKFWEEIVPSKLLD